LPSPLHVTNFPRLVTSQLLLFAKPQLLQGVFVPMQSQYSGLEVAPFDGLIPKVPKHSDLEVRHGSMSETTDTYGPDGSETTPLHHEEKRPNRHKICGLRKVTFWLTLALVATIIVAIVGGSVGGTLLLRRSQTNEAERVGGIEYVESISLRNSTN
jgi:hypothetical protein